VKSEKYLRREERQEKNEFYTRFCYSKYRSMKQYSEQQKREKNLIIFLSFKKILFYQITISYMVILHFRYAFGIRDL
jgi:hypothetical protein